MRTNTGGQWCGVGALALATFAGTTWAQAPADACASAPTINAAGSYAGSTVGASLDGSTCIAVAPDVWFRFVAPAAGQYRFDTCNPATNFDTTVAVRTACGGAGSQLACNDDAVAGFCPANGDASRAVVNLTANQVVFLRISSALPNVTGNFVLNVVTPPPPPPPPPVNLGPDVVVNQITDVARWGTGVSGGVPVTAYSVGTDSCNPGDSPVLWIDTNNYLPDYNNTQHPVINQNMYRLKSYGQYSRFEQLGQSWLKHGFVSTNSPSCGTCQPSNVYFPSLGTTQNIGGDALGVNCSDTYGAGLNGSQGGLGAKNIVHATNGTSPFIRGNGTGDADTRMRLQVPTADVTNQPAGTRYIVDGLYITADDAQFVRPNQTVAFNALNNASWREVTAASINNNPGFAGGTRQQEPGIFAWRFIDSTVTLVTADHDDTPHPTLADKFIRSRFWVAAKVTTLGDGLYRYEYAVYNHNSDRSAEKFIIALPDSGSATDVSFHAPRWHSGEPYSNAAWTFNKSNNQVVFSTESFSANVNANAIRWGTLFNFGFTSDVAPTTGAASLKLFKPGFGATPLDALAVAGLPVPTMPPACLADFNGDSVLDPDDLSDYIACYFATPPCGQANFNGDGATDPDDLSDYITAYFAGC